MLINATSFHVAAFFFDNTMTGKYQVLEEI
jgi:hypothetical protein